MEPVDPRRAREVTADVPTDRFWLALALPCFAVAAQALIYVNHAPLIPRIIPALGISPAQAGLLSTASFAVGGLLALPSGAATDRFGAKLVMAVSLLVMATSSLALAAAMSYGVMLVVRAVSGFGVTTSFIAGGQYVKQLARGRPEYLAQGLLGASIQLGLAAAVFALPGLGEIVGWRGALALSAAPAVAALGLWLSCARRFEPARRREPGSARVFRAGLVWRLALAHGATFGLAVVVGNWVTVYFVREFAFPLGPAGMLGSLGLLLGVLGRPLGGVTVARAGISPRLMILLSLGVTATGVALMAWPARPLSMAVVGLTAVGLASSLGYAAIVTLATAADPKSAGVALGLVGAAAVWAVVVGAPVAGLLFGWTGNFGLAFFLLASLPAVALLVCRRLPS